uniref:Uncharacterized protein n=1 Tax=Ciona intestinalis TaxID=7719 RepID=F6ZBZ5_CIOIN
MTSPPGFRGKPIQSLMLPNHGQSGSSYNSNQQFMQGHNRSQHNTSSSVSWFLSGGGNNVATPLNTTPFADVLSVLTRNTPGCSTVAAAAVLMTSSSPVTSTTTSYQSSVMRMNPLPGPNGGFDKSFTNGVGNKQSRNMFLDQSPINSGSCSATINQSHKLN